MQQKSTLEKSTITFIGKVKQAKSVYTKSTQYNTVESVRYSIWARRIGVEYSRVKQGTAGGRRTILYPAS